MKNSLWLILVALSCLFSCGSKEEKISNKPLSEQQFEFEIYDSLVVDYLGNLYLGDISPDGKTILLIQEFSDSILIINESGNILNHFTRKGDGPGFYKSGRLSPPVFLSNTEFAIPADRGLYCYDMDGNPTRSFFPTFYPTTSLINYFDQKTILHQGKIYYPWEGRLADSLGVEGRALQPLINRIEILDLATGLFSPALPFPKESKFSSSEVSYLNINYTTSLSSRSDTLFVSFRNDPNLYAYSFSNLDSPASVLPIPFPEHLPTQPKSADKYGQYEMPDLYVTSINAFEATEKNRFLISYSRGLKKEEYDEVFGLIAKDRKEGYKKLREINTSGMVIFDGKTLSSIIREPEELGHSFVFVSENEIWFTPDYDLVEKDYLVLYKTRLVSK
ncbi:MAG: hypothetical protein LPK25_01865 [Cyclobacteriaceae bacterium]|nr:hypothetical protein [Cyclobacteriaceae bacterium]MDX5465540.1 hypothetical protein [Cyclobacteriaceae bacterium]